MNFLTENPQLLGTAINGLRFANVFAWGLIGLWGATAIFRVAIDQYDWRDLMWSAMALLAFAIEIGQVRALLHVIPPATDWWSFVALLSFFLSGVGIFIARAVQAPDGHKRAALLSHLTLLVILVGAGLLS